MLVVVGPGPGPGPGPDVPAIARGTPPVGPWVLVLLAGAGAGAKFCVRFLRADEPSSPFAAAIAPREAVPLARRFAHHAAIDLDRFSDFTGAFRSFPPGVTP